MYWCWRGSYYYSVALNPSRNCLVVFKLSDPEIQIKFQSKLDEKLTRSTFTDLNAQWESLRDALYSAEEMCGRTARESDPWISTKSKPDQ